MIIPVYSREIHESRKDQSRDPVKTGREEQEVAKCVINVRYPTLSRLIGIFPFSAVSTEESCADGGKLSSEM